MASGPRKKITKEQAWPYLSGAVLMTRTGFP